MRLLLLLGYLLGMTLLLAGCGVAPIVVSIRAARQLNPNHEGRSLPVELRLYQLRQVSGFQEATFWQLWQHDHAALGQGVLQVDRVMIEPGAVRTFKLTRQKLARYVGVMAVFRQPGQQWKLIKTLAPAYPLLRSHIVIHLMGSEIK